MSYTRARELLIEKLVALGLNPTQFGLHSLRAGGASAAANAGISDRLFKSMVGGDPTVPRIDM